MEPFDSLSTLALHDDEYRRALAEAERQLGHRNRVLLRAVEQGATHAQIADILGISRGRAGQIIHAARRAVEKDA